MIFGINKVGQFNQFNKNRNYWLKPCIKVLKLKNRKCELIIKTNISLLKLHDKFLLLEEHTRYFVVKEQILNHLAH